MPRSIAGKLTRMNMVVSGSALLLATAAFAAYDIVSYRDELLRNMSVRAEIVGANSIAALLFNDAAAAEHTLSALEAAPGLVSVHIYTPDGRPFASYWRGRRTQEPPPAPQIPPAAGEISTVDMRSATVARRIVSDGTPAGIVYIRSDLQALYARMQRYSVLAVSVFAVAAAAALFVSALARRTVARPIADIARLARRVSDEQNYALRAVADRGTTELAALAASFNDMLSQIQRRDESLEEARATLEQRVHERTADLDAVNRELEAFSYSVSHDLRAPLRHVAGFASMLEKSGGTLTDQQRRYIRTIVGAAGQMGRLIDDLLAFSRTGRTELRRTAVDLGAVVADVQRKLATTLNGRQVEWRVRELPIVYGDAGLLRVVFDNLLANAVKYTGTRERAEIDVGSRPGENGDTVVYVGDNGVGFDMQYAGKLFGVFQRLHSSDDFEGTGIGLATVRRIVTRHGGRAWAEGRPGEGATFYITLPNAETTT